MEPTFDLLRGLSLVIGHLKGQTVTLRLPRKQITDIHAKVQQHVEYFGKDGPIQMAQKFSKSLAKYFEKSSNPHSWEVSRIIPILRVFRRDKEKPLEINWDESPDQMFKKLDQFRAFDTQKIVFITHGFLHHNNTIWMTEMKDAILEAEDLTVIIMGWGGGANIGFYRYEQAAKNIQSTGYWLANHLTEIRKQKPDIYLHGVGHSLGAHLFGFAGRCSKAFDRISGLDPAGPNFETECLSLRLDKTDAQFVDVMHTDGYSRPWTLQSMTAPTNHYGSLISMGTVDFYVNWGHSQPGCENFSFIGSHNKAFSYFIESIRKPGMFKTGLKIKDEPGYMSIKEESVQMEEEVEMGFYCGGGSGNYYIEMNKECIGVRMILGIV